MKKLFLFLSIFLVAAGFNSCTNDDDEPDNIVGKWRLSQVSAEINQQPIDDDFFDGALTECNKKTTLEFFENGTYKESGFEFIDETNTCDALAPTNGTWENLGNSKYDISGIDFSGLTIESEVKVTFGSSKMFLEIFGTMTYEGVQVDILIKVTFIDNDAFVPDTIIGKWRFDQEFINNVEQNLSACKKTMTIQFFDTSVYEEKDFDDDNGQCIALEVKNGFWRNLGSDKYEISNLGVDEFKVTFANNKMTVEFTDTKEGITATHKVIFVKVTL